MPPQNAGASTTTTTTLEDTEPRLETKESSMETHVASSKRVNPSTGVPLEEDLYSEYFPPLKLVWRNITVFIVLHLLALNGLYLTLTGGVMWQTLAFSYSLYLFGGLGITAGAHRLWSHKSYKAKLPLRILLAGFQTLALQNSIWEWSRDHRVHHKYSETHADPHDARKGFFFAHMGWLICKKHEAVKAKGAKLDISDLEEDSVVMFQKKYYIPLIFVICIIAPTFIPWYLWQESLWVSYVVAFAFRYCFTLHATWFVNSAAHLWGSHPYDKNINPAENKLVSVFSLGEGWHNYHHVFPWDYKAAELGFYKYNWTKCFIDSCAWLGLATDLKFVPEGIVKQRVQRTGDGSHSSAHESSDGQHSLAGPWGWGDKEIPKEDAKVTLTQNPSKCD